MEINSLLTFLFPKRMVALRQEKALKRAYEAVSWNNYRPKRGDGNSGNAELNASGEKLRNLSRYIEENFDAYVAVLSDLTNNIVGAGVAIDPMVKTRDGSLHSINAELKRIYAEWSLHPEVTDEFPWPTAERMICNTWLRDGEVFLHHIENQNFDYQTEIDYAIELLEPDYCPYNVKQSENVVHGVELTEWGKPIAYHMLKNHPGDRGFGYSQYSTETRRIPSKEITHLKFVRRLHQVRGVPLSHSVFSRLYDLKDIDESERIAGRVAATLAVAIKAETGLITTSFDDTQEYPTEIMGVDPGQIFRLMPGESIETVKSDRPNEMKGFREAMYRAIAGGSHTRASAISKNYSDGTYSSNRQELVEATVNYRSLFVTYRDRVLKTIWPKIVKSAVLKNLVTITSDIDINTLYEADYRPPALPWIDPQKEAQAWNTLIETGIESRSGAIRARGRDPEKVFAEIKAEEAINPRPAEDQTPAEPQNQDEAA